MPSLSDLCASVSLWFNRLFRVARRHRFDRDMAEEMRARLDAQTQRNLATGMSPDDARAAARRQFGGLAQVQERARDVRGTRWLEELLGDVRFSVRLLAKQPGFTLVAVLTFALGLGVNTGLFAVFDALVFRPLPLKNPHELVKLGRVAPGESRPRAFSFPDYIALREQNQSLLDLAALTSVRRSLDDNGRTLADAGSLAAGNTQFVPLHFVSANYLELLGARLELGRGFAPEEDQQPGGGAVVVLSHRFWSRYLQADPDALGRTIHFGNTAFTIIGVTALEFVGATPSSPAAWLPLTMHPDAGRWFRSSDAAILQLIGRLSPDTSTAQATAELSALTARLTAEPAGANPVASVRLDNNFTVLDPKVLREPFVAPLFAAFALVLAIACANVANLLLARGATRQHEIGVRLALGAPRGRLIRQLLTETSLVALLGGAAGFVFAQWTLHLLRALVLGSSVLPAEVRNWVLLDATAGLRAFGFSFALALVAGLASGMLPALRTAGPEGAAPLRHDNPALARRFGRSRLRDLLVVGQIAVCLALLIAAGLLVQQLRRIAAPDTGMRLEHVFNVHVPLHPANPDAPALRHELTRQLTGLPGVVAASEAASAPLLRPPRPLRVARASPTEPANPIRAMYNLVAPEYFETVGLDVVHGRKFATAEAAGGANVALVSETLARRLWPGTSALGQLVGVETAALGDLPPGNEDAASADNAFRSYAIVGVVRDTRSGVMWHRDGPVVYLPLPPASPRNERILVRTAVPPHAIEAAVREVAMTVTNSKVQLESLGERQQEQIAPFRGLAALASSVGMLALLLAAGGLFGVMSYIVNSRVREIGIRLALGATARAIAALFLRSGLRLVGIGSALGLAGGIVFWLVLRRMMADLRSPELAPFAVVTALLAVVTLLACWLPARRAAKVDPVVALRAE